METSKQEFDVTEFINGINQPWQAEIGGRLRQLIHEVIPGELHHL